MPRLEFEREELLDMTMTELARKFKYEFTKSKSNSLIENHALQFFSNNTELGDMRVREFLRRFPTPQQYEQGEADFDDEFRERAGSLGKDTLKKLYDLFQANGLLNGDE